ncbi:MAG: hypothetical protein ACRDDZ_09270 [Marinifilaceae bacterium]
MKNTIDENISKIRSAINEPWKQHILIKDPNKWNMLCACMDVIEDTQLAINAFFLQNSFSPDNGAYLYLYGFLQALFMQQDGMSNLHKALFDQTIKWKDDYPDIYELRELRNDSIGHPTSRRDKSFHFISRNSITKDSFQIWSYGDEFAHKHRIQRINFMKIKETQEQVVSIVLKNINNKLQVEFINHKKKFQGNTLISLIPNSLNYSISKIFNGISSDDNLVQINFDEIQRIHHRIKDGVTQRYGSIEAVSGVKILIDKIDYILAKLSEWIINNTLYKNKDAEVFLDAMTNYFMELKELLVEIDIFFEI